MLPDLSSQLLPPAATSALGKVQLVLICGVAMVLTACSDVPSEPSRPVVPENDPLRWSDAQRTAYEQCLQDNMAVATAWEAIEQGCKDQVGGAGESLEAPMEAANP